MGVINNLINIRKIVGENWDGTTLHEIALKRPIAKITRQPVDTSAANIRVDINTIGFGFLLQRKIDNVWVDGSYSSNASNSTAVSLSSVTTTTVCRVAIYPFGYSLTEPIYSNEFTVTRTEAQSQALKNGANIETTETIDVVKEDIKKG